MFRFSRFSWPQLSLPIPNQCIDYRAISFQNGYKYQNVLSLSMAINTVSDQDEPANFDCENMAFLSAQVH